MTTVVWDDTGNRKFETGVDHGVLYPLNTSSKLYDSGFAWNGLTGVKEKPGGAASNPQYADNMKYLSLQSQETFAGTIEAFTYPDEFGACDGTNEPTDGVMVGQQGRQTFGLSYRTKLGDDVSGADAGYKLHLVYGCLASPSEKDYATLNDSPAAVQLSWDFETTPVAVTNLAPTSLIVVDSTRVDSTALADLEDFLYGTVGTDPSLPMPDDVLALFSGTVTTTDVPPAPTAGGTNNNDITMPTSTGVVYTIGGVTESGVVTITANTVVKAHPATGYKFPAVCVDEWYFPYTP
jgi:hypothetical protein